MSTEPNPDAPHVLVLYAHPAPQRAPLMRALATAARELPGVRLRDLYELYPDFDVDGAHERNLLAHAGVMVLLHPIRWYGMPSLLKEWMEVVLQPGWAYSHEGTGALNGKGFWLVTTSGSGPDAYRPGGLHGRPFADFMPPFEQTAALCGMDWIEPLVIHGAMQLDAAAIDALAGEFQRRLMGYTGTLPTGGPPDGT